MNVLKYFFIFVFGCEVSESYFNVNDWFYCKEFI